MSDSSVEPKSSKNIPQNPANKFARLRDFGKLWFLVRIVAKQKVLAFFIILTTILTSILALPMPIILKNLVDAVLGGETFGNILGWLGASLAIITVGAVMGVVTQYVQSSFSMRMNLELRRKVFRSLLDAPMEVLVRLGTGDLTTRLTVDVEEASSMASGVLPSLIANVVSLVGLTGVMFYLSPTLAAFSLLLLPMFWLLGLPLLRRIREIAITARDREATLSVYITEILRAFNLAKAFSRERSVERRAQRLGRRAAETRREATLSYSIAGAILSMLGTLGPFAVLGLGGYLASTGGLSPGTLLAFYACLVRLIMPATSLAQYGMVIGRTMAPVNRIMECLGIPNERHEGKQPAALLPVKFTDVRFRYQEEQPLLEDISLGVKPRQQLGIAGASGAGKSTLLGLISGLLLPQAGEVTLGGEDALDVDLHYRRRRILLVQQDQPVLGMSAAENLRLGNPEATLQEMWRILELVGLADVIRKQSQGIDEVLGVAGAVLSGGEKTRLCLARALLMQPQVLLLDEPFAALDDHSAQLLWRNMTEALPDTAFVLVSHHPFGLELLPHIVVLKDGRIVEEGEPAKLAKSGGEYARLCRSVG